MSLFAPRRSIITSLVVLAGFVGPSLPVFAQGGRNPNPGVAPPSAQYAELSARWWQWVFSVPASENPLFDTTGEDAHQGQPTRGNIFFLAGLIELTGDPLDASAERSITIPAGTRLFFPVLNSEADNVGFDPPLTLVELREIAKSFADEVTDLYVIVDGRPLNNLFAYRTVSPVFSFTLPEEDNIYQFFGADVPGVDWPTTTVFPAVGDGYYVLLNPLPPGEHTINFGGESVSFDPETGEPVSFKLDITYHITVTAGKK